MQATTITPHITIAIGQQARLYHVFITTAPARFDAPSTMTLYESTVTDLAGLAMDPDALDALGSRTSARLVLIDAVELAWQRARYAEAGHRITAPDEVLVGLSTLQRWLWQRLTAPFIGPSDSARAS